LTLRHDVARSGRSRRKEGDPRAGDPRCGGVWARGRRSVAEGNGWTRAATESLGGSNQPVPGGSLTALAPTEPGEGAPEHEAVYNYHPPADASDRRYRLKILA
jgi:hypothetical protein